MKDRTRRAKWAKEGRHALSREKIRTRKASSRVVKSRAGGKRERERIQISLWKKRIPLNKNISLCLLTRVDRFFPRKRERKAKSIRASRYHHGVFEPLAAVRGGEPLPVLAERTLHGEKVLDVERRREERIDWTRVVVGKNDFDANLVRFDEIDFTGVVVFGARRRRRQRRVDIRRAPRASSPPAKRGRGENRRGQNATRQKLKFRRRRGARGRAQARYVAKLVRGRAFSRANEFNGGNDRCDDVETGGSVVTE